MNKTELVRAVASQADVDLNTARNATNAVFQVIADSLAKAEPVALVGFGSFGVANRAAGVGRNPSTGEEIQIPARRRVTFRAGSSLKDQVNA